MIGRIDSITVPIQSSTVFENGKVKREKTREKRDVLQPKKQPICQNQKMAAQKYIKHYNNATYDIIHFIKGPLIIPILLWKEVHFATVFSSEKTEPTKKA